jgi:hypothetical protein
MDTSLDSLDPVFRPLAFALLARCVEAKTLVLIVNTRRTDAEQADAIARKVSWVPHSKHQDGLAIDIVPYSIWSLHGDVKLEWNATDPIWMKIGAIGESIGLRWGGRWKQADMGHFEYVTPQVGIPA